MIGALTVLDMSAAFDSVDHSVLLEVLRRRFGIDGNALRWMAEFLNDRNYTPFASAVESLETMLRSGVPQGSVLGPRSFTEYAEDLSLILTAIICIIVYLPTICRAISVADHMMLMRW